ncbi:MAG: hypothetical protein AAGI25_19560 [Bacteroidota bacterium]
MKRKTLVTLGFLLILVIAWLGYTGIKKLDKNRRIQNIQDDLSKILNQLGQTKIDTTIFTILIFFNSQCEYCELEVHKIHENIDLFDKDQLLFCSFEPENEAITFLEKYSLSQFYIISNPEKVMSTFTGGVPQTLIYRNGKLTRHFRGGVQIDAILEALRKE